MDHTKSIDLPMTFTSKCELDFLYTGPNPAHFLIMVDIYVFFLLNPSKIKKVMVQTRFICP